MSFYSRNLPHWHPEGAAIFLTWRLCGSLPPRPARALVVDHSIAAGRRFRAMDAKLDKAEYGPRWLEEEAVARCVVQAIGRGETALRQYIVHAFVVMPNHVHLLIEPRTSLARITNGLKGVSARDANRILARTGKHFWQDESFDHWVRKGGE